MTAMATETPALVMPGQRLASADDVDAGAGTFVRNGFLHASLIGRAALETDGPDSKPVLRVVPPRNANLVIPEVGSIVTCRVTSISGRFAKAEILLVESKPSNDSFRGMIRIQDVRSTEKDTVVMFNCFRPGDVVLARIISLGDARSYYLSTAENELGVIWAQGESGAELRAVSWDEMECTRTGIREQRKVAKPQNV